MRHSTTSAHSHCSAYITVPTLCHSLRLSRATMRGDTPYWTRNASSMPAITKPRQALAQGCRTCSLLRRDRTSSTAAQAMDTQVCAANSLAADRKSTRLNSSHGYISYAVFCLKKKDIDLSALDAAGFLGFWHTPTNACVIKAALASTSIRR